MKDALQIGVDEPSKWRRALWGASWGSMFGLFCTTIAFIQFLISGGNFEMRFHIALHRLILIYMVACAAGGVVIGLLLPLARWKLGSMMIGFLAVLPIGIALEYASLAGEPWSGADTFVVIVGSLAIGVPSGASYYDLIPSSLRKSL